MHIIIANVVEHLPGLLLWLLVFFASQRLHQRLNYRHARNSLPGQLGNHTREMNEQNQDLEAYDTELEEHSQKLHNFWNWTRGLGRTVRQQARDIRSHTSTLKDHSEQLTQFAWIHPNLESLSWRILSKLSKLQSLISANTERLDQHDLTFGYVEQDVKTLDDGLVQTGEAVHELQEGVQDLQGDRNNIATIINRLCKYFTGALGSVTRKVTLFDGRLRHIATRLSFTETKQDDLLRRVDRIKQEREKEQVSLSLLENHFRSYIPSNVYVKEFYAKDIIKVAPGDISGLFLAWIKATELQADISRPNITRATTMGSLPTTPQTAPPVNQTLQGSAHSFSPRQMAPNAPHFGRR
jgi:chromosome segregation ATPase